MMSQNDQTLKSSNTISLGRLDLSRTLFSMAIAIVIIAALKQFFSIDIPAMISGNPLLFIGFVVALYLIKWLIKKLIAFSLKLIPVQVTINKN